MPFGMMNLGATLVRAMRKLFQGLATVDSYMDDTIVHAPTWQEHMVGRSSRNVGLDCEGRVDSPTISV